MDKSSLRLLVFLLALIFINGCGGHGGGGASVSLLTATMVSSGDFHACATPGDGTVKCWGLNSSGQLGNDSTINSLKPVAVVGISTATQVSAGGRHSCALLSDSTVVCWGNNSSGQLGNSTTTSSRTPVQVTGLTSVAAISAGEDHTCAVLTDGTVKCWGFNSSGQLGNGSTSNSSVPVNITGLLSSVTALSAGGSHTCAVLSNGRVECWGANLFGQLGNSNLPIGSSTPVLVSNIFNAAGVAAGANHTCSNLTDGRVLCWGDDSSGQAGVFWTGIIGFFITTVSAPSTAVSITNVSSVSAGSAHTCATLSNGTVECWGDNSAGQLGNGTIIGFTPPGGLAGPPNTTIIPVFANGISSATMADVGFFFSCARVSSGNLLCWGNNNSGQLGNGTTISTTIPANVIN